MVKMISRWYNSEFVKYVGIASIIVAASHMIRGCNESNRAVYQYRVGKYHAISNSSKENLQTLVEEIRHDDPR